MTELAGEDFEQLRALEDSLWRAETRFDREYMERILSPDFFEFGRSGRVYSRADILALQGHAVETRLRNVAVQAAGSDVALVTYVSDVCREDGTVEIGNRSSLWARGPGGWQLRFHQGTPVLHS